MYQSFDVSARSGAAGAGAGPLLARGARPPCRALRRLGAVILATAAGAAAAEPLPFRLALRAFTTADQVHVFDGRTLWARPSAGGPWRERALTGRRVFDVGFFRGRLWVLDEAGVAVIGGGEAAPQPALCSQAFSLAVSEGALWCAEQADAAGVVTVRRHSLAGQDVPQKWQVHVPAETEETALSPIARMARACWFLLADAHGAVGFSLNRAQLLFAPADGPARVLPWTSPLQELRQGVPHGSAHPRLPELHVQAVALLPDGRLLVLPGLTALGADGTVGQRDRLLLLARDGRREAVLPLPRPAVALVSDPAGPLILYPDDSLQGWQQLHEAAAVRVPR